MKIGSLFSGYGGLDMAVEAVTGGTTVWVSDIDKGACKILTRRAADVPNLGDITTIDWATVEPVDIITGGFPCQDLSHAGKRAGLKEGTRSGLWSHMARAIDELRPRLVVAENVRGLLSADAPGDVEPCSWCVGETPTVNLRALGVVLADLADLGYDAQWCGLRAADVGACHGRFRVFLVAYPQGHPWRFGHRDDVDAADTTSNRRREGRAEPAGIVRRPDVDQRSHADVTLLPTPAAHEPGYTGDLVGRDGELLDHVAQRSYDPVTGRLVQTGLPQAVALLPTPITEPDTGNGHARNLGKEARHLLPTPTATDAKASGGGYNGQNNVTLTDATTRQPDRFGDYSPAIARWESVIGRPAPDPTEPTGKGGAHRLSPKFVEFMMGLPAGWVTDVPTLTRNEALKALGNGVVPQQAEAALRHMLAMEAA